METVLIGFAVSVITQIMKKFNISSTAMSMILSLVGGGLFWYFSNFQVEVWEELVKRTAEVYASSQIVFNLIKKFGLIG